MANSIEFAKNYTGILDEAYQRAAVSRCLNSGWRMTTTPGAGTASCTTTARPTGPLRRANSALVRHPATCQSLRRGSSPEISAMAMQEGRRSDPATTRSRPR